MPNARALSQARAGPSGQDIDEVIYSEEAPDDAIIEALEAEFDAGSHPGEGMLLKNPRSSVKIEVIKL